MNQKSKNSFLFIVGGILLAFILMTDLYPFMRTAMFAEPIKNTMSTEIFIVKLEKNGRDHRFDTKEIGLSANRINYLGRKYHYNKNGKTLLKKISNISKEKGVFQLIQIHINYDSHLLSDSSIVATYEK